VHSNVVTAIRGICKFPSEAEASRILSGFKWIGLLSDDEVDIRAGNLLDTLCGRLEGLMKYEEGERDLVMLQHKFVVEWADGKVVRLSISCISLSRVEELCRTPSPPPLKHTAILPDTARWR
jgi:hypothetical protein